MLNLLFWQPYLTTDPSWADRHPECLTVFLCSLAVELCLSCPNLCSFSFFGFLSPDADSFMSACVILLRRVGHACKCVDVSAHAFAALKSSPKSLYSNPQLMFLGICNLIWPFHLLFSKRSRDQALWQWPLNSGIFISPSRWLNFKVSKKISVPKGAREVECWFISDSTVFACGVRGTGRSLKVTSVVPRVEI